MAGGLLLAILVLISVPIQLTNRAMLNGQARVDSQHQLREPIDRLLAEVRRGFAIEVTAIDGTTQSNSITIYDRPAKDNLKTTYRLDVTTHQILRDVAQYGGGSFTAVSGSPYVFASNITLLAFGPQFQVEPTGTPAVLWSPYTLPVPHPSASVTNLPVTNSPLPRGALLTVRVVGLDAPGAPALDVTTSVAVRN